MAAVNATSCPACHQTYNEQNRIPRILPQCGHTFCQACLENMKFYGAIQCPTDLQYSAIGILPVASLVKNMTLLELARNPGSSVGDGTGGAGGGAGQFASLSLWVQPEKLELGEKIGAGNFGEVREAWLQDAGHRCKVAVKVLSNLAATPGGQSTAARKEEEEEFAKEMEVLFFASKHCAFVCQLIGIARKDNKLCIIMKRYKNSIEDIMKAQDGKLTASQILKYGTNICRAMAELHSRGILMRDLKPANFLVDDFDTAVVADFGLSKILKESATTTMVSGKIAGTPCYMPPEAWGAGDGLLRPTSDVWSFACSVIDMFTGKPPYHDARSVLDVQRRVVLDKERPQVPSGLPFEVEECLRSCFAYDAKDRPGFDMLLDVFQRNPIAPGQRARTSDNGESSAIPRRLSVPSRQLPSPPQSEPGRRQSGPPYLELTAEFPNPPQVEPPMRLLSPPQSESARRRSIPPYLERTEQQLSSPSRLESPVGLASPSRLEPPRWLSSPSEEHPRQLCSATQYEFAPSRETADQSGPPQRFLPNSWVRVKRSVSNPKFGWSSRDRSALMHDSLGILKNVDREEVASVQYCFSDEPMMLDVEELEVVPSLQEGDSVRVKRSVMQPRFGWGEVRRDMIGNLVSVDTGKAMVEIDFPGYTTGWVADPSEIERLSRPFRRGAWARIRASVLRARRRDSGLDDITESSLAIVKDVLDGGKVKLDFCFMSNYTILDNWNAELLDFPPFLVDDQVALKQSVRAPRYEWGGEGHDSIGIVVEICDDGLIKVQFPGRGSLCTADPGELMVVHPAQGFGRSARSGIR